MKKRFLLLAAISCLSINVNAANLLEVYQQAQNCDPTFQQAIAQRLSTKEGVPISIAALLPNIDFQMNPSVTRTGFAGTNFSTIVAGIGSQTISPRNTTTRAYNMTLTATQPIFNFASFNAVASSIALSHEADATLNAALQNLMIRVANAYLAILQDEDNLSFTEALKLANAESLDQAKQQYNVGLKTITDVYTAQASYDSAVAGYIAAQTTLQNDRENLRVITGKYYPYLSKLSEAFPLVRPQPDNIDIWVKIARHQNWTIKQQQYQVSSNLQLIRQTFAGHLPTLNAEGVYQRLYQDNVNGYDSLQQRNGPGTTSNREFLLNLDVPIFQGGAVVSQTNQAIYNYQAAYQQLELTIRNTVSNTRQTYLNLISGISLVSADKQAIKSNISSLEGMEASYRVGTETLVDVLNQQQKLFQAQLTYAQDRYNFVKNILLLKQAAGTLSFNDMRAINSWLVDNQNTRRTVQRVNYPSAKRAAQLTKKKPATAAAPVKKETKVDKDAKAKTKELQVVGWKSTKKDTVT